MGVGKIKPSGQARQTLGLPQSIINKLQNTKLPEGDNTLQPAALGLKHIKLPKKIRNLHDLVLYLAENSSKLGFKAALTTRATNIIHYRLLVSGTKETNFSDKRFVLSFDHANKLTSVHVQKFDNGKVSNLYSVNVSTLVDDKETIRETTDLPNNHVRTGKYVPRTSPDCSDDSRRYNLYWPEGLNAGGRVYPEIIDY